MDKELNVVTKVIDHKSHRFVIGSYIYVLSELARKNNRSVIMMNQSWSSVSLIQIWWIIAAYLSVKSTKAINTNRFELIPIANFHQRWLQVPQCSLDSDLEMFTFFAQVFEKSSFFCFWIWPTKSCAGQILSSIIMTF